MTEIEYFSRYGLAEVVKSRNTENVLKFLKIRDKINIKCLICDSAKENISNKIVR